MGLVESVKRRDVEQVRALLASGADPNAAEDGELPLIQAIDKRAHEIFRLLLEHGADVERRDAQGYSPVIAATGAKEPELLRVLLAAGARNLDAVPTAFPTIPALMWAVFSGRADLTRLLLEAGADPNQENPQGQVALFLGLRHPDVVRLLLAHGADPNRRTSQGAYPLLAAASQPRGRAVRLLLDAGAYPNVMSADGVTPLLIAVQQKVALPVRWLLKAGADPNTRFRESSSWDPAALKGGTALIYAAYHGRTRIVADLLQHGAQWDIEDERGNSALQVALVRGHEDIVQLLQQAAGPKLSVVRTPEHYSALLLQAVKRGNLEQVRQALAHAADPNIADEGLDFGMTSLMHACNKGHSDIVELLLAGGAKVNLAEPENAFVGQTNTALHYAAEAGHADCVRRLLVAGADPEPFNSDGCTPLMLAAREGNLECARCLLEFGADPTTPLRAEDAIEDGDELPSDPEESHYEESASESDDFSDDSEGDAEALTAIGMAAAQGHIDVLAALIDALAQPSSEALLAAAHHLQTEAMELLLERGYSVHVSNRLGEGPLHLLGRFDATITLPRSKKAIGERRKAEWYRIALERQLRAARLLLEAGAAIDAADAQGRTPLMRAASGRTSLTRVTEPSEGMEMHDFAETDPSAYVRLLLDAGADPNKRDQRGDTSLHHALRRGYMEHAAPQVIRRLVEAGVHPDAQNAAGQTPLMLAVGNDDVAAARKLLKLGADVRVADRRQRTALHLAAESGRSVRSLRDLLDAGADPNALDGRQRAALDYARDQANDEAVQLLRKYHSADRGQKEAQLAEAIDQRDLAGTQRLLDEGADPLRPVRRMNALVRAVCAGAADVVAELARRGVDVQQVDDAFRWFGRDSQAVHYAAYQAGPELLRALLNAGADARAVNRRGWTPLTVAGFGRRTENLQLLLEAGGQIDELAADFLELLSWGQRTQSTAYQAAVRELTTELNTDSQPLPWAEGLVCWRLEAAEEARQLLREHPKLSQSVADWQALAAKRRALVERLQPPLRERGLLLVGVQSGRGCSPSSDYLALFPTTNSFALVAAMGVYGNDAEISCPQLVSMLRRLYQQEPFDVHCVKNDALEIQFHSLVREPKKIARRLYKLCPDLIDQGVGTMKRLVESLETDPHVRFWWD